MTSLFEVAALLLEPNEREVVLGDLAEAGESAWRSSLGILGLVMRRQLIPWKSWRPWLAVFALALPFSFLLMGFSLSVSSAYRHFIDSRTGFWPLISHAFLLIAWSATGGFVVGSLSRRTLWVSIAASCLPCLFCLARFRESSLPSVCLLLYLAPAIGGVFWSMRTNRIKFRWAIILAVATTMAMIPTWAFNWVLVWPAWYIVATARKTERETA